MPPHTNVRDEDEKKHCKTPERGDVARINGHVGYIVTRIPGTWRAESTTIIETANGSRYTALSDADVTVVRPAFRSAADLFAPQCPVCGDQDLRVEWSKYDVEPGVTRPAPVIYCNTCEDSGEDRALRALSNIDHATVLISEGVIEDAR